MSDQFLFDSPSRVTVGTVGPTGARLFVLQASEQSVVVTVKMEKVQVARLAVYLGRLLRDQERPGELPGDDELALATFDEPDFVAQSLALSYEAVEDRVVLLIEEFDPDDRDEETDDDDDSGTVVRLAMTREQAAALAIRATALVEAGRPPCPLCGYPLDPRGHSCPRTNGHSAPLT